MESPYTHGALMAISNARKLAAEGQSAHVDSGHLCLAALEETDYNAVVLQMLQICGVPVAEARLYVESTFEKGVPSGPDRMLTRSAKRVLVVAGQEARRQSSELVGVEHLFIACLRHQRGAHVGEVLRPLGLDAGKCRDHLRGLLASEKPYRRGNPLNHLTEGSKKAVEAAHSAMRASYCGRISTAHLLLGVLDDPENVAVETLRRANVDIEALKREITTVLASDGEIASPQKKFAPATKRALERAKKEAERCENSYIGPQHLLFALLPQEVSVGEKMAYGQSVNDPLEGVWPHWPVEKIRRLYEEFWRDNSQRESVPDKPAALPSSYIKLDGYYTLGGVFWWLWLFIGPASSFPLLLGFGSACFTAIGAGVAKNYVWRDRGGSFCFGMLLGLLLAIFLAMFIPSF